MGSRGRSSDEPKNQHVSLRIDDQTAQYIDQLALEFGYTRNGDPNRSKTLRQIIKTHNGLLFGNFFGIVDNDRLGEQWGDVGQLLSSAVESDRGVPQSLAHARLADIVAPLPVLVQAAEVELEGTPIQTDD